MDFTLANDHPTHQVFSPGDPEETSLVDERDELYHLNFPELQPSQVKGILFLIYEGLEKKLQESGETADKDLNNNECEATDGNPKLV